MRMLLPFSRTSWVPSVVETVEGEAAAEEEEPEALALAAAAEEAEWEAEREEAAMDEAITELCSADSAAWLEAAWVGA